MMSRERTKFKAIGVVCVIRATLEGQETAAMAWDVEFWDHPNPYQSRQEESGGTTRP